MNCCRLRVWTLRVRVLEKSSCILAQLNPPKSSGNRHALQPTTWSCRLLMESLTPKQNQLNSEPYSRKFCYRCNYVVKVVGAYLTEGLVFEPILMWQRQPGSQAAEKMALVIFGIRRIRLVTTMVSRCFCKAEGLIKCCIMGSAGECVFCRCPSL